MIFMIIARALCGVIEGVFIGDNVIGGQNIRFHSSNHVFEDSNELIWKQGVNCKGIIIGNDCWIGAGEVFCDGVQIGNGCVIGANAIVVKKFPEYSITTGKPARTISIRKMVYGVRIQNGIWI